MSFNSLHFLIFLPLVLGLYYLTPSRFRWMLVFFASCYFYMVFVPKYILILFFIIVIDFAVAHDIEKSEGWKRKFYLLVSLVSNIALLAFFKYFNFIDINLAHIAGFFNKTYTPGYLDVVLPIGLSFHTFQSMSYAIDVYRGKQKAETHLGYFSNYVLFFPQMVAGPIERYERLGEALKEDIKPLYSNFVEGFRLVLFGLFVKMVVADNIAPYVNEVYSDPMAFNSGQVLLAVFFFSIQIYADFYGYSTIAVGCARLMGIKIMDNFKTPYLSANFTEFWSRWHISLSTWFRDYLYIPLGGNKVSIPRWCFNIMFVFLVSGLWHGASWTFVIWGGLHGWMLITERLYSRKKIRVHEHWSLVHVLLIIKTFVLTSLIWIFFRAETFAKAKLVFKAIFKNFTLPANEMYNISWAYPLVFSVLLMVSDFLFYNSRVDLELNQRKGKFRWAFYAFTIFCLLAMAGTQKYTFIYFQF